MTTFRVWAPAARTVDLVRGERRDRMRRGPDATYEIDVGDARPGDRYAFSLDGAAALPDPRSASQPDGVHGTSEIVDHGAFRWSDAEWRGRELAESVLYELHVGTFTPEGTFDAAIGRLDHLVRLGVDALQLMPVAQFPGDRGWGYDGADLFAPDHAYGGPDGLKRLVDACHGRGITVLLDVVYSHLGPDGNYLPRFAPYLTDRYRTPWGDSVNFDGPGSDEVRAFFIDNALMWLRDYHIDGLRLDAVQAIIDTSGLHILEELSSRVAELERESGRRLWVIAESDLNDPRIVSPRAEGGRGFDAQWNDDFHHALHVWLAGERSGYYADFAGLADVAKALRDAYVYDGRYSGYRWRRHGRPADGIPGERFLGYLQTHDQIGNRARGERSSLLMSTGRLMVGAALVLTSPFVPMLFMGEEWGARTPFLYFTDHREARLGRAVREGRRAEFAPFGFKPEDVPDPQDVDTFRASKLDWGEPEREPHRTILEWYRELIALRRRSPDLRDGRREQVDAHFDADAGWIVLRRGRVSVAANAGPREVTLPAPGQILLRSDPQIAADRSTVRLPADSVAVLETAEQTERADDIMRAGTPSAA